MAVFFKNGKIAVKKYDDLCPDELVYLKYGKYILDLDNNKLIYLDDDSYDPINMNEIGALPFYISLDIDYGRDKKIPLTLDRKGNFVRTDGIFAFATIETLFSSTIKEEAKS